MTSNILQTGSVSAVCVVDDEIPSPRDLQVLQSALLRRFTDVDLVIVANGCSDEVARGLKRLIEKLPDTTIEFLSVRIDPDSATLVGIENAVGDWIVLFEPDASVTIALPAILDEAAKGNELVVGLAPTSLEPSWAGTLPRRAFVNLYSWLNGASLLLHRPTISMLSRPAALYVLRSPDSEMLLRARKLGGGFPASEVMIKGPGVRRAQLSGGAAVAKGARMILASSIAPLRFITVTSIATSSIALLYSGYVVAIYLFKSDVQAGWTTMSLQIASLTFFFSLMFALLAEYIAQIHAVSGGRRRYFVTREIRSQTIGHRERLNVVDSGGRFHLGAPADVPLRGHDTTNGN